jgi:hypothetical protein
VDFRGCRVHGCDRAWDMMRGVQSSSFLVGLHSRTGSQPNQSGQSHCERERRWGGEQGKARPAGQGQVRRARVAKSKSQS